MIPRYKNNTLEKRYPIINILHGIGLPSYESSLSASLINSHSSFVNSKSFDFHNVHLYLNSALHDSKVTDIYYNNYILSISLNDFYTCCFCNALIDITKVSLAHNRTFPIILSFSNMQICSLAYINRNNKLIPLAKSKHLHKLSSYLYDQVIELEPNSINIGILFWATPSLRKQYLLLQIKCKKFLIEELQRKSFLELLGDKFIDLYDRYWEERQKGVLFDYGRSTQFITEYLQCKNHKV